MSIQLAISTGCICLCFNIGNDKVDRNHEAPVPTRNSATTVLKQDYFCLKSPGVDVANNQHSAQNLNAEFAHVFASLPHQFLPGAMKGCFCKIVINIYEYGIEMLGVGS